MPCTPISLSTSKPTISICFSKVFPCFLMRLWLLRCSNSILPNNTISVKPAHESQYYRRKLFLVLVLSASRHANTQDSKKAKMDIPFGVCIPASCERLFKYDNSYEGRDQLVSLVPYSTPSFSVVSGSLLYLYLSHRFSSIGNLHKRACI